MLLNNAYIVEPYPIVEAGIIILAASLVGLGTRRGVGREVGGAPVVG